MRRKLLSLTLTLVLLCSLLLAPVMSVGAADEVRGRIEWAVKDGASVFTFYNLTDQTNEPETLTYRVLDPDLRVVYQEELAAGAVIAVTLSLDEEYTASMLDSLNRIEVAPVKSRTSEKFEVHAVDENGQRIAFYDDRDELGSLLASGTVQGSIPVQVTAPATIVSAGADGADVEWTRVSDAAQLVRLGVKPDDVVYRKISRAENEFAVTLIDEFGNTIQSETHTVPFADGKGKISYTIAAAVTDENGKTYQLLDAAEAGSYEVAYYEVQPEYTYKYKLTETPLDQDYSVRVLFKAVDENGNFTQLILGEDYFNYNDNQTEAYVYNRVPEHFTIRNADTGSVYHYRLADAAARTITHQAGDPHEYEVAYELEGTDDEYFWVINLVDMEDNQVIRTETVRMIPGSSEEYAADSLVETDGVKYILDVNAANVYTHSYNTQAERVTNVPYHEVDKQLAGEYDIQVQYMDVATKEVLLTRTLTSVAGEQDLAITTDEEIETADTTYVKLPGQSQLEHEFYSPQRTYTVYYRDINDDANADTVINIVEQVPVIVTTTEDVGYDVPVADDTAAAEAPTAAGTAGNESAQVAAPDTLVVNEDAGTAELLDEEGVPLADGVQEIEDGGVPLARGVEDDDPAAAKASSLAASRPFIIGVGAAGLAILFLVLLYLKRRKAVAAASSESDTE